jgi:hypothetical protein
MEIDVIESMARGLRSAGVVVFGFRVSKFRLNTSSLRFRVSFSGECRLRLAFSGVGVAWMKYRLGMEGAVWLSVVTPSSGR